MKQIDSHKSLNDKILKGVNILSDAVSATLGPKGRTCIIKFKGQKPIITKDGISVAKSIDLEDPFENLGAQIVKQAAEATVQSAGDGTTTSITLARAILMKAQPFLATGTSPVELKKGMDQAVIDVVDKLKNQSKQIESLDEIIQIATISANGDKGIGTLIGTAIDKIGKDGSISIQEGKSTETSLDVMEGFSFDSGLVANAFINDERRQLMRYDDCYVLVTDHLISTIEEILPILELVARDGKAFVIVAEQVEGQALAALIMNTMRGNMKVAAVKAPRYGEERRAILQDLAITLGTKFVSRDSGIKLQQLKLTDLGKAKSVEASRLGTTIVGAGGNSAKISARIESIKEELARTDVLPVAERIQERITRLSSGIGVIRVGGLTEVEMTEKKHRIEDALEAVNAAQKEGIICGGGKALINAAVWLQDREATDNKDFNHGYNIIIEAIKEPFKKIVLNANLSPDVLLEKVTQMEPEEGFDISIGSSCNLIEKGIIDPLKVVRCALQNATSAASTLISTNYAIIETE